MFLDKAVNTTSICNVQSKTTFSFLKSLKFWSEFLGMYDRVSH